MTLTGSPLDYFSVFFAGILMSFTPCIYPIIPIVASTIAGANTSGRPLGGFLLSLLYVLGLAVAYSLLAFIAAWTGQVFGSLQTNPWVFLIVGNVILLFALVMLDVFSFPIVSFQGAFPKKGAFAIFSMGFASGFIVGPCTAPVLGTLLLIIGAKQKLLFSISLLFVFSFGVSASLLLAGTFSGFLASLPKAGEWMVRIKKLAGLVLLIVAEYYLVFAGQLFY